MYATCELERKARERERERERERRGGGKNYFFIPKKVINKRLNMAS
jgi:hypothetical protein